ncbi:low specificity L-threonine aldolase [Sulfurospirillum arcachonense]|uniref:threonine aldolase family protein n=1 Tax=Sulfurospirillum arcachonense TaxID=57666 RepID=UPI00046A2F7B|nr:low specificity L-threonine aldolase [Sulfurospirillum arcachonense]
MEDTNLEQFASDNYSGICPEVLEAMIQANSGTAPGYGDDIYTAKASEKIREIFECDCEVFFVFNGTAANALSLASMCQSYHSVICHELAHIETDECGAPEFASNGSKLLLADGGNGKLNPTSIEELATKRVDIHYPKPKVISLTQSNEVGVVYSIQEIKAIKKIANKHNLKIHMDGARIANALVTLGCTPAEMTWKAGIDVLSFGGTKNGMAFGEAVVIFDKNLAEDFEYRVKQAGQLASKMRFISSQWLGLLENDVWLKNAKYANDMALYFASQLEDVKGVSLVFPVHANEVFLKLKSEVEVELKKRGWMSYAFIGRANRFVFSWNSSKERIDELVKDIKEIIQG